MLNTYAHVCIGSEIHHGVVRADDDVVVYKGTNPAIDSYSAFFDNDHKHQTKMSEVHPCVYCQQIYVYVGVCIPEYMDECM